MNRYTSHKDSDGLVARLETLDDAIFEAINGNRESLDRARVHWQKITHAAGEDLVEESREQYLRYATDVWKASREEERIGPEQVFAAIDVITMLTQ